VSAAVVRGCDGSEALLAGGVPLYVMSASDLPDIASLCTYDLQLHSLAIKLDGSDFLAHVSLSQAPGWGALERTKSTPIVEM
jgi:hypothetical protein